MAILFVLGSNHRTAPLELRESLAFEPEQVQAALEMVQSDRVLEETMILSTCNRTEFYSTTTDPTVGAEYVRDLVNRIKGSDLLQPGPHRYTYQDREMVSHLFRVAASLDSMMVGEMQILGQVKDAYHMSCERGAAGVVLNRLLSTAMRVGKRTRSETKIGAGSVSVASAAVTLTTKIMSDLSDKRVLLVGAGETGRLAAQHFAARNPAGILIANRSLPRAEDLARELHGEALGLEEIPSALPRVDVVVCATRSKSILIDESVVAEAMKARRNRPMVLVDISVPRNVAPEVARVNNVFAYPIDALQSLVEQNLTRRRREVPHVERIIGEEVESFFRWARTRQTAPVIKALRGQFEAVRRQELERLGSKLSEAEKSSLDSMTRSLINKLLHHPTITIRGIDMDSAEGFQQLDAACRLFDLHPDSDEELRPLEDE